MSIRMRCFRYLEELAEAIGTAWNGFWFQPRPAANLRRLSRVVSLAVLIWLALLSFDLIGMWSGSGWLSAEAVHQATTNGDPTQRTPGFSHLFWIQSPALLWCVHGLAMLVAALSAWHVLPRFTLPTTWLIVLCYVHRGPLVTGQFESVLSMLLLYLALGSLVIDYRRTDEAHWVANVVTRLLQLHLCGFYVLIAANKLGTPIWWTGDATWYLLTDPQQRLVDLSFLTQSNLLVNGITHLWLLSEILFPLLIWNRHARPIMIVISTVFWTWTTLATGLIGYGLLMICANLVFFPSDARFASSAELPS